MTLGNNTIPGELEILGAEQQSLYAQIAEVDKQSLLLEHLRSCQVRHLRGLLDQYAAVETEIKRIQEG